MRVCLYVLKKSFRLRTNTDDSSTEEQSGKATEAECVDEARTVESTHKNTNSQLRIYANYRMSERVRIRTRSKTSEKYSEVRYNKAFCIRLCSSYQNTHKAFTKIEQHEHQTHWLHFRRFSFIRSHCMRSPLVVFSASLFNPSNEITDQQKNKSSSKKEFLHNASTVPTM